MDEKKAGQERHEGTGRISAWLRERMPPPALLAGMAGALFIIFFGVWNICRSAAAGAGYAPAEEGAGYMASEEGGGQADGPPGMADGLPLPDMEAKLVSLKKQNPDTAGWLHCPAFGISAPILQDGDNRYYARHTFSGERDPAGSIFLDCMASDDFRDMHTVVYGRGAEDGGIFGSLEKIREKEEEEPDLYFWIFTEKDACIYRVVSWHESDAEEDTFRTVFEDEGDYRDFLSYIEGQAEEKTDVGLAASDRILTLAVRADGSCACLAVHGVLAGREPYAPYSSSYGR